MRPRTKTEFRRRRHFRVRRKITGTADRPRMSVFVSNQHMYVQFIDDVAGVTLAAVSTLGGGEARKNDVETAKSLGKAAADALKGKGIETVVFDRGGFSYSGRVKALADAAREAGLSF